MKKYWILRLTNEKYEAVKEWWLPPGCEIEVTIRSTDFVEVSEDGPEE